MSDFHTSYKLWKWGQGQFGYLIDVTDHFPSSIGKISPRISIVEMFCYLNILFIYFSSTAIEWACVNMIDVHIRQRENEHRHKNNITFFNQLWRIWIIEFPGDHLLCSVNGRDRTVFRYNPGWWFTTVCTIFFRLGFLMLFAFSNDKSS